MAEETCTADTPPAWIPFQPFLRLELIGAQWLEDHRLRKARRRGPILAARLTGVRASGGRSPSQLLRILSFR
jgi:hypothetical protein